MSAIETLEMVSMVCLFLETAVVTAVVTAVLMINKNTSEILLLKLMALDFHLYLIFPPLTSYQNCNRQLLSQSNNVNTRTMFEICSKVAIKTPE